MTSKDPRPAPASPAQDEAVPAPLAQDEAVPASPPADPKPVEHGGPRGPEPTRYNDWERNGRCSDF
ncbi:hypothetical protein F11_18315 [Rhodospirillum rubrum F11]|uniref:DUF1674 domain-containing protein n=1 Tax=Rhodospirillum rubrum (strain ATCC 11170 / ATH 1.1.1 / DSM 467 / LMG 4362 / NCIMB 8255 / S1) TaxID=269796 RepID=Q2RNC3_RHORT|nr:succinate dehydrogenase assembly factor 4 [Rhodospirillum rubrum]ABC24372.1 hypothetical protein Rru_A3578 [Rhodospirillum rubrum ATCC 11170]AEO50123.1 hypothetical protein F11_18315 [Rhodospirillum rubrum F11]